MDSTQHNDNKDNTTWREYKKPLLITLVSAVTLSVFLFLADHHAVKSHRAQNENLAITSLSNLKSSIESTINSKLFLTSGLKQHVILNSTISESEFNFFAQRISSQQDGVISVQLAKNNFVSHVFPMQKHGLVLGMNLLQIPGQNEKIRHAIDKRIDILDGPLELLQGGNALIHRTPIYTKQGDYWGLATILIDSKTVFDEAGINDKEELFHFTITKISHNGETKLFHGIDHANKPSIAEQVVNLPGQHWVLRAIPSHALVEVPHDSTWLRLLAILLTIVITYMTWRISTSPIELKKQIHIITRKLERYQNRLELLVEKRSMALNKANFYLNEEINRHLKTEKKLLEKEDRLEKIAAATFECIIIHDEGTILYINNNVEPIFGYTPEEVMGKSVFNLIPPEAAKVVAEQLQNPDPNKFYEIEGRKKDGTPYIIEVRSKPISFEGKEARIGSIRDITQRKAMEKTHEESERNLRGILDNLQDTFYRTDAEGKLIMISPSVEELLGFTVDELLGTKLSDLYVAPDGRERFLQELQSKNGRVIGYIADLYRKDRSTVWVSTSAKVYFDNNGNPLGVEGTSRNITAQKQMEEKLINATNEALHANKAKSQFLATINHEIRNPMNGIIVTTSLLEKTTLTEQQKRYTDSIKESSEALFMLINDVLDLSKIESGKVKIHKQPFQLTQLVQSLKGITEHQLPNHKVEMVFDIAPDVPTQLEGDSNRLKQVLLNLLGNAIKFTHEGKITLQISPVESEGDNTTLRFDVIDTGIGFMAEHKEQIFSPFYQINNAHSSVGETGTGLGLAICNHLVSLMGGKLQVESEPNQGAHFYFELPFNLGALDSQPDRIETVNSTPLTILLVEDHPISQIAAKELLSQAGHQISTANNGLEAVQAVKDQLFDLVLMDIRMPEMDGVEATKIIRAMDDPVKANIPIFALTANVLETDKQEYLDSGMNDIIAKPISPEAIIAQLQELHSKASK